MGYEARGPGSNPARGGVSFSHKQVSTAHSFLLSSYYHPDMTKITVEKDVKLNSI